MFTVSSHYKGGCGSASYSTVDPLKNVQLKVVSLRAKTNRRVRLEGGQDIKGLIKEIGPYLNRTVSSPCLLFASAHYTAVDWDFQDGKS
jgi:hypothetical protein